MNTQFTYRSDIIAMTIGSDLVIGYDPNDINSRAEAILVAYEAKVATIAKFVGSQTADIQKAAVPDVVKAAQLAELTKVADDERTKAARVAMAEVEALKQLPQRTKGIAAQGTITKEVAAELNKRYEDR